LSSKLRILVVDDHPINRRILAAIFAHLGCAVATAQGGLDALAASSVGHYDLICLDRHMPGFGGDDVVNCLPHDQFVLAWSTDDNDVPERFNGTLPKPVTVAAAGHAILAAVAWQAAIARRTAKLPQRVAA